MKRVIALFTVGALIGLSSFSYADAGAKFQAGVKDVIMAPLQLSDNVRSETTGAKFLPFALVGGVLKGSFYMAKKIVTGTLDAVTSPLDLIRK